MSLNFKILRINLRIFSKNANFGMLDFQQHDITFNLLISCSALSGIKCGGGLNLSSEAVKGCVTAHCPVVRQGFCDENTIWITLKRLPEPVTKNDSQYSIISKPSLKSKTIFGLFLLYK